MQSNQKVNQPLDYILGSCSITVVLDGKPYTINKEAHTYNLVLEAVKQGSVELLRSAVNIRQGIADGLNKHSNKIRIEGSSIFYEDREVTGLISSRIFEVIRLGLDVQPMVKFLENLMQNPSKRAVDELFGFMEACSLPITPDGYFLAYKRVRDNYTDCHSGTMDNSVGKVVQMPRNLVDEDKARTCSAGLHFCSYDYLKYFGGERVMVLKINPAEVVSIPKDYQNSKGRCCKYEVVDELPLSEDMLPSKKIQDGYSSDYYDIEYEYEDDFDEEILDEEDEDMFYPCSFRLEQAVDKALGLPAGSKLCIADVQEIKQELAYSSLSELAKKYNVSARTIARIRDGKTYKNI